VFGSTRLVLQEEVVFEESKIGRNHKVNLADIDKDCDLKNGDGIQMHKLDFVVVKEALEEIAARKSESVLEEGFG
jgi:ADP-glucose pyrophosphorylase